MYPPAAFTTSQPDLVGTTAGIIVIVVVAVAGLAVMIGMVYWADSHPDTHRPTAPRRPRAGTGAAELTQASAGPGQRPGERVEDRHAPEQGHPHGKRSSWVLVAVVVAAFIAGGVALIIHAWWLVWACAGIVVLAVPVGKAIGIMDDNITWGSTPAVIPEENQDTGAGSIRDRPDHAQTR